MLVSQKRKGKDRKVFCLLDSFTKCLLSTYYIPGTKNTEIFVLKEFLVWWGK